MIDPLEIPEFAEPATTSGSYHGVRLSTRVMPAALAAKGGDWCEAFVVSRDVVALSIGDVCGHGTEKATAMTALRQSIREAAWLGLDPAQTLTAANAFLRQYDADENATALFALLNTSRRSLAFANAGHPPPLVAGPLGAEFLEFPQADLPLGIVAEIVPNLRVVSVPAAALLVLYTDGVTERGRNLTHGEADLRDAALFAYQVSHLDSAAVIERQMFLTGSNLDDAAILTVWTPGAPIMRGGTARYGRGDRFRDLRERDQGVPVGEPPANQQWIS
jgi:serine phosphatase RsbU (regulator of sigma subunit)